MGRWDGTSEAYRRSFATLCAGTVDPLLDVLPPGRLLDVGCGTGGLLAAARDRGRPVTGVDAEAGMTDIAHTVPPGQVVRAALPDLPFSGGAFDAVAANFVLNHVPDPRASMTELARVTRPGGVVAATVWPADAGGWGSLVGEVLAAAQVTPLPSAHLPEELDFERSPRGLAGVASDAGLRVVEAREVTWTWRVTPQDLWAGISGGVATVGQNYLAQDEATRARVERELVARAPADGAPFAFASRAVLVVAARPPAVLVVAARPPGA